MKRCLFFIVYLVFHILFFTQSAFTLPFYSDKGWTIADKKNVEQALKEWERTGLSFKEETDCTKKPSLTFVWKGEKVFKDWSNKGGPNRENALAWWLGAKPFADWDTNTFPIGEIYLNLEYYPTKDRPGPDKFYVDPTPDKDDGFKPDAAVPTYLTSTEDYVFDNYDLLTVLKHEIGHFLGLGFPHSNNPKDLMYKEYKVGVRIHPTQAQITAAKEGDYTYKLTPIPEPSTLLLLGSGLTGIFAFGRKRLFKKA